MNIDNNIGKTFAAVSRTEKWDICFELIQEYYREHGDWAIPVKYVTNDGVPLGMWCHNVRKRARSGLLKRGKIERLEKIGFDFTEPTERSWEQGYKAAKKFFEDNGDLCIPAGYVSEDGVRLDGWVAQQRFQISTGKIKHDRKVMLEKIGIHLTRSVSNFESGLRRVSLYKEEFGNYYVPAGYVCEDGFELGVWVVKYRTLNNAGTLPKDRKDALDAIGFCWDPLVSRWENFYGAAKAYYEEHGNLDCKCSYKTKDGINLGAWLASQKTKYRKGELDAELIKLLEEIGIVWNPAKDVWMRNFAMVKAYYTENGRHMKYSYVTDSGYDLGGWLRNQYNAYYAGRLSTEQRNLMEQIHLVSKTVELPIRFDNVSVAGGVV